MYKRTKAMSDYPIKFYLKVKAFTPNNSAERSIYGHVTLSVLPELWKDMYNYLVNRLL